MSSDQSDAPRVILLPAEACPIPVVIPPVPLRLDSLQLFPPPESLLSFPPPPEKHPPTVVSPRMDLMPRMETPLDGAGGHSDSKSQFVFEAKTAQRDSFRMLYEFYSKV